MPFKDIDRGKLIDSINTKEEFQKKIGSENKLYTSNLKDTERIPAVELVLKKHIRKRLTPIQTIERRINLSESTNPVVKELKSLNDKLKSSDYALTNSSYIDFAKKYSILNQQATLSREQTIELGVNLLEDIKSIDPSLQTEYLQDLQGKFGRIKRGLASIPRGDKPKIFNQITSLESQIDTIFINRGVVKRRRLPETPPIVQIEELEPDEEPETDEEFESGNEYQEGYGINKTKKPEKLKIGSLYNANKDKLVNHNILSLRYNKNGLPVDNRSIRVSDNVKQTLLNKRMFGNIKLSEEEKKFLANLFLRSNAKLHPSKAKEVYGNGLFTSIEEAYEKLKVNLGEFQAGNKSKLLKNEISDIAHFLFKNNILMKQSYKDIMKLITGKQIIN